MEAPSTLPTASTDAQPQEAKHEAGNMPNPSPAVGDAQGSAPVPAGFVPVTQYRGPDGRLYKQPSIPESPRNEGNLQRLQVGAKSQPNSLPDNDLERTGGIDGLSTIPKAWGKLPPSVSLSQEIAWVQSERLMVVKEQPGRRTKVDLSKASVPAPSMSALSWLETSIRSYAKFVEVASKQASSGQDEAEFIRRERMAIGEIRAILAEMMPAKEA